MATVDLNIIKGVYTEALNCEVKEIEEALRQEEDAEKEAAEKAAAEKQAAEEEARKKAGDTLMTEATPVNTTPPNTPQKNTAGSRTVLDTSSFRKLPNPSGVSNSQPLHAKDLWTGVSTPGS